MFDVESMLTIVIPRLGIVRKVYVKVVGVAIWVCLGDECGVVVGKHIGRIERMKGDIHWRSNEIPAVACICPVIVACAYNVFLHRGLKELIFSWMVSIVETVD